eukprot:6187946-Pleurochrysis_carterae.AAC.1
MDERGYMITEEVWVEKEVEKPLPPTRAPHAASARAVPSTKPQIASISEEVQAGAPPTKARAKGKSDKPQPAQGSIKSFFSRK